MPRELKADKIKRAEEIAKRLEAYYPDNKCHLTYDNDVFRLTIAVLLSAQTTDAAVNKVTPLLWEQYPDIPSLASANVKDVEKILHSIGFFRNKAANCIKCAQMVLTDFGGEVPADINELQKLPGVGRKTANIVMNEGFGIVEGIAVDTHVFRIVHLLKLSTAKDASHTEQQIMKIFPQQYWGPLNHNLVSFGREFCIARRPQCDACILQDLCPAANQGK